MTFSDKVFLIARLHKLILRKGTGTPKSLAYRLDISEATAYRYIKELKNLGAEIEFCTDRNSYYYKKKFSFFR